MYVSALKRLRASNCQNQQDAFFTEGARSGEEGSSFGGQFPQIASIFGDQQGTRSPAGAPDSCVTQGFSRQGRLIRREVWMWGSELN
ncbi:MAG: hypothetical protein GXO48_09785 [Chlorobi bacterium]|nr:hypothetical protein [Chlorobiota bacterium]